MIPEEETEKVTTAPNTNPAPVQQLDGTDSEWRYRGRTENECGETQPISAPPGLVAQKDEGFQRFYKAVVSPSHVRVTAGGRIVPNTRASSSPTGKWTKEKSSSSSSFFLPRPVERDAADIAVTNGTQFPFGAFPSLYPGYAPAMHGSAYPMFPWQIYNTFCLPAPMSQTAFPKTSDKDNSRHQQDGVDDRQEGVDPSTHQTSTPTDGSRPFYFNGQWAMPHNPSLFAYGMPAFSGFPHPSMVGSVAVPAALQPTTSISASAAAPAPAPAPASAPAPAKSDKPVAEIAKPSPAAAASPTTQTTASLPNPPISSIRPSEITKKQIDVLRGSLKYLEDQLLYNKHQIDEKWMEYQAHMVRQQVEQFEKNLQNQKSFEESYYPKTKENSSASSVSLLVPSADDLSANAAPNSVQDGTSNSGQKPWREKDREYFQTHQGINSTKSVSLFAPKRLGNPAEPTKKGSTLPVHAALAPPFQPQTEAPSRSSFFPSCRPDIPYLIGMIPTGGNPDKARETGYQYVRDLTDDELRARHMYWGKAPHHLQRGLPKFDGKDFYPPSPTRDQTSNSNDSLADVQSESDCPRSANGSAYDPFLSLGRPRQRVPRGALGQITQSEVLTKNSSGASSVVERGGSCTAKIGRQHEDARKTVDQAATPATTSSKFNSSSEEGDDSRSILFKGRKPPTAAGYGIWYPVSLCSHH